MSGNLNKVESGALAHLCAGLRAAADDGEGLRFTAGRLRDALAVSRLVAQTGRNRHAIRFLRQLGFAYLDAPDRTARALIRRTIADHLATLNVEVPA